MEKYTGKARGITDMRRLRIRAYAKINLSLSVMGKRPDGYHLISTRMQAISLHDDVTVEIIACARGPAIDVKAGFAPDARLGGDGFSCGLPQGRDNLAYDAAGLALRLWGSGRDGVQITIAKRIPMAAGLAGGSADAAAVLLGLARLLAPGVDLHAIIEAGASIGADVPFCIAAAARGNTELGFAEDDAACSSALCDGIGDELTPSPPGRGKVVLVRPAAEVKTPQIYSDWDDDMERRQGRRFPVSDHNDLAPVAIRRYPLIGRVLDEVRGISGADRVFMTGSGPTIVALYEDAKESARGFAALRDTYKDRADAYAVILSELI